MKRMAKALLLTSTLLLLNSCVTLGPKVEKKAIFVDLTNSEGVPVKIGRVMKNVKVPVDIKTGGGDIVTEEIDIGGWFVVPPPKQEK